MTLQELLTSYKLTNEQITAVNSHVDIVINRRISTSNSELNGKIAELETSLKEKEAILNKNKDEVKNALIKKTAETVFGKSAEKYSKYVKYDDDFEFTEKNIKDKMEQVHIDLIGEIRNNPFIDGEKQINDHTKSKEAEETEDFDEDDIEQEMK